jgi:RimJ/RimL family protein N-acetyltransferase
MLNLPSARNIDTPTLAASAEACDAGRSNWRQAFPPLSGEGVTLRALRASDAPTLLAMLTTEEVARFISPPPTTVEGFEKFIAWTHRQLTEGRYICFGIVPAGRTDAVGLIQVRALDKDFGLAEWGFAIGSEFWGTGIFQASARAVLDFVFAELPVYRLEARAVTENGRGNGALKKIGASCEAVLRQSFQRGATRMDQMLWSIERQDWIFMSAAMWKGRVH